MDRNAWPRAVIPFALLLGILAVSTASLFVRFAQRDATSLVIAAGRLGLATIVLAPVALIRHRPALRSLTPRDLGLGLLAGVFLALHFASWITSLEHTSVVSSVVLVTTTPLWVALLSPLILREPISRITAAGIALALGGGALVGIGDAQSQGGGALAAGAAGLLRGHALRGDALALFGAWMMTAYLMVGRRLRARVALVPYVFLVYGMAAVVLALAVAASGQSMGGLTRAAWLWIVLLALVPQLVGHSTFNWALRHLPAALVAIALLGEPVGSAALAFVFLREAPAPLTILGAGLILIGIVIASLGAPSTRIDESVAST